MQCSARGRWVARSFSQNRNSQNLGTVPVEVGAVPAGSQQLRFHDERAFLDEPEPEADGDDENDSLGRLLVPPVFMPRNSVREYWTSL